MVDHEVWQVLEDHFKHLAFLQRVSMSDRRVLRRRPRHQDAVLRKRINVLEENPMKLRRDVLEDFHEHDPIILEILADVSDEIDVRHLLLRQQFDVLGPVEGVGGDKAWKSSLVKMSSPFKKGFLFS